MSQATSAPFELTQFCQQALNVGECTLTVLSGDASFRQYFLVTPKGTAVTYVAMFSPPELTNNTPFVSLNAHFVNQQLPLPEIIAADLDKGFVLLNNLGNTHLADRLAAHNFDDYPSLIDLACRLANVPAHPDMAKYDEALIIRELEIFSEWLVDKRLNLLAEYQELVASSELEALCINTFKAQPQVTVHRDYHSRNIMHHQARFYLIDYQDAVTGPLTYDLVSLIRDCYISMPEDVEHSLIEYAHQQYTEAGLYTDSFASFKRAFDITGVQRHLKAAGIFSRLDLRDGKSGYLKSIYPTLKQVVRIARTYPELRTLGQFIEKQVMPLCQRL